MLSSYLRDAFKKIGLDVNDLEQRYLSPVDIQILNSLITCDNDFYQSLGDTSNYSDNLENLIHFLSVSVPNVRSCLQNSGRAQALVALYTSDVVTGSFDCFRFDLSLFPQVYHPCGQVLTLYRVGRQGESAQSLGCSWATEINGVNSYSVGSSLTKAALTNRPMFVIEVDDSQVLFVGASKENELVLKPGFTYRSIRDFYPQERALVGI